MNIKFCGFCGKELHVIPAKTRTVNYCSRQCWAKFKQGKPFHTEETKQKISKTLMGVPHPAVRDALIGKRGEQANRWQGDNVVRHTGWERAQRWFPIQPCEICGADPEKIRIHRHHVDGITTNNVPSNIRFLCTKHHIQVHKLQEV